MRRRARSRRRIVAPLAAAAAVAIAAAAVAAGGGWLFSRSGSEVTAVTHVQFHGRTWTVAVSVGQGQWFCTRLVRDSGPTTAQGCGVYLLPVPKLIRKLRLRARPGTGPPFGGLRYAAGSGELWFGAARADVTRIAITDDRGRVFSATTVAAPPALKTAFRFWAIPLSASRARAIAGYDAAGKLVNRARISSRAGHMVLRFR